MKMHVCTESLAPLDIFTVSRPLSFDLGFRVTLQMSLQTEAGFRFFNETPGVHLSGGVQTFIEQEIQKPSKVWVQEVVGSKRENEAVKLRTPEFVLLPDLNANRRQYHTHQPQCSGGGGSRFAPACRQLQRWGKPGGSWGLGQTVARSVAHAKNAWGSSEPSPEVKPRALNWLAIVADPSVRSIRDLRGEHIEMLERLYDQCVEAIQKEFKVEKHDIMVFANYPPSVYKLHFHFCAPFFTSSAYDAFRMHPLSGIINNLRICSDYYKISSFQVPVHVGSELFRVTSEEEQTTQSE
jgi:hypothetical protein